MCFFRVFFFDETFLSAGLVFAGHDTTANTIAFTFGRYFARDGKWAEELVRSAEPLSSDVLQWSPEVRVGGLLPHHPLLLMVA